MSVTRDVVTTLARTLGAGDVVGRGSLVTIAVSRCGAGEPHLQRLNLVPDASEPTPVGRSRTSVHLTDIQLADVRSPGRIEILDRQASRQAVESLLPAYRPHEPFQAHALEVDDPDVARGVRRASSRGRR